MPLTIHIYKSIQYHLVSPSATDELLETSPSQGHKHLLQMLSGMLDGTIKLTLKKKFQKYFLNYMAIRKKVVQLTSCNTFSFVTFLEVLNI